jgi:hypothetical protein
MATAFSFRRPAAALGLMLALAACSTDVLTPPERTGSLRPVEGHTTRRAAHAERVMHYPAGGDPESLTASAADALPIPAEGVDIDGMLGSNPAPGGGVVGLAEEQSREIAEGSVSAPVVDGIGTDGVHALSVPGSLPQGVPPPPPVASAGGDPDLPPLTRQAEAAEARRQAQFLDAGERAGVSRGVPRGGAGGEQVAFLPRAGSPLSDMGSEPPRGGLSERGGMSEPSGRMPASEVACRQRLTAMGVRFTDVPRISNGPSCGIDYPIQLSGLSGNIAVKPAVKLNCEVTEAFAHWVKNELAPSARYRYLSGIGTIKPLGGYSCRTMNSRRGAAMSEHAHGNAIDVGKFVLKNGKEIDVRKPGFFAFREKGLLKAVRQDSCKYFNTVLGPGSDANHKDHFHFDLRNRKSGYRHCD